jgi:hypothetical protein
MPTYNGWNVVTIPAVPAAPASLEVVKNALVAANTNPFTGQQQIQDWQAGFYELSVSMQPMSSSAGQAWVTFLTSLEGMAGVFQFPSAICAQFPKELTSDGTTPRYWRLKSNSAKWSIKRGSIYYFVFEIREAT